VVGTKETLKALEKGEARAVLVARDAESRGLVQPVLSLSESQGIEIHYVDEMKETGVGPVESGKCGGGRSNRILNQRRWTWCLH